MAAESFKFNIIGGDARKNSGQLGVPKNITKSKLKEWIRKSALDDYTRKELIKKIDNQPSSTLEHFYKNMHIYLTRIQEEKKQKGDTEL